MAKRNYANWLKQYMEFTQHSEAPDEFHFWTGVSVIAGALRRRVWIDERYFQWTPNFFIFFVAPPGVVSKSTTVSIGMKLLREVDGVQFGPDAVTWQALTQALADAGELVTMPDGMMYPMSCLTITASELGTFFNPQDREMVDVLVSLWDGQIGVWTKATKTQGCDVIENPWLNIIGCTTPAWIEATFPAYMIGGGFTSRSIFVYAHKKRKFIAYPSEEVEDDEHKNVANRLVHDLRIIAELRGQYKLQPEAIAWGTEWYEKLNEEIPEHMTSDRYGGYLARKQTHIHKLAIVLAAASREELVILKEDLEIANNFVTGLERDMLEVFKVVGAREESGYSKEVLNLIRATKKKGIARRKLWKITMHLFRNFDEFEACIGGLIESGDIKQRQEQSGILLRINYE